MPVQLAELALGRDIDFQVSQSPATDRSHLPFSLQNLWRETQNGLNGLYSQDTKVVFPTQPLFKLPMKIYRDRKGHMVPNPFRDAIENTIYFHWGQRDRQYDSNSKKGQLFWNDGQTPIAHIDLSDPASPNVYIVLDQELETSQRRADAVVQALETEVLFLIASKDPAKDWRDLSMLQGLDPYRTSHT